MNETALHVLMLIVAALAAWAGAELLALALMGKG